MSGKVRGARARTGRGAGRGGPARRATPVPNPQPDTLKDKIGKAIDKTTAPPVELLETRVVVHRDARKLKSGGTFGITTGDNPREPIMMVMDNGAWRMIFADPGSQWEVRPKGAPGGRPALWLPGQQQPS